MAKNKLENAIAETAGKFALEIVKAIKASSLQELIALQAAPEKRGRKTGPKTKAKPGRKSKKKPGRPKNLAAAPVKRKGKRISSADKAKLLDTIVAHLNNNPGSGCSAIAKKFKLPSVKMGKYLKELRAKGRVGSVGKKVGMVYSVK